MSTTEDNKNGWMKVEVQPFVESPTWGQITKLAKEVMERLGGSAGAAKALSGQSFIALCILDSLMLDKKQSEHPIFNTTKLT